MGQHFIFIFSGKGSSFGACCVPFRDGRDLVTEEAFLALHLSHSNYIGRGPRLVGCGMWDKFGERPQYVNKTCQFSKIPNHKTSHLGSLERVKCALF